MDIMQSAKQIGKIFLKINRASGVFRTTPKCPREERSIQKKKFE